MNKFLIIGLMMLAFANGALVGPASAPEASASVLAAQSMLSVATGITVFVLLIWGLWDLMTVKSPAKKDKTN